MMARHSGFFDNNFANPDIHFKDNNMASTGNSKHQELNNTFEESNMDVDVETRHTGNRLQNTLELIAAIESMKTLVEGSKAEVEHILRKTEMKIIPVAERDKLNEKLLVAEKELEGLKTDASELRSRNNELETELETLSNNFKLLQQENANLKTMQSLFEEQRSKFNEQQILLKQHKKDLDSLSKSNQSLADMLSEKQTQCYRLSEENRKVTTELVDCKTRLSRLMGSKLSDNNPDIADLSDKNRPTKLAEKYQEIYDNQWTDAFEKLDEHFHDERTSIIKLKELLEDIKRHCDKMAQDQKAAMLEAVVMNGANGEELPRDVIKQLKDIRRVTAELSVKTVYEQYLLSAKQSLGINKSMHVTDPCLQPFVKSCLEICWLMSVQDPPLSFASDPKYMDILDTNKYKFYTKTGSFIDFVVWPPLMLHIEGPLLSKGIAQACSSLTQEDNIHSKRSSQAKRKETATALTVDQTAQAEPSVQIISRPSDVTAKETEMSSDFVDVSKHHEPAKHDDSNIKPIVAEAISAETTAPRPRNKNAHPLVQNSDAAASYYKKFPRQEEIDRFKKIATESGHRSPKIKAAFGERYDMIHDYCMARKLCEL